MKGIKQWIKRLLGLLPPQPFPSLLPPPPPEKKATQAPPKMPLPEGVKMAAWGVDKQLQRITPNTDGMEWQKTDTEKATKEDSLTEQDIQRLSEKELDPVRASELKILWAGGLTAKEAAEKTGKGHRQIQDYWAAFNKAQKDYAEKRNA